MKTYEIWVGKDSNVTSNWAAHVIEADRFSYADGAFHFKDSQSTLLHAIVATPGMFVRTVEPTK